MHLNRKISAAIAAAVELYLESEQHRLTPLVEQKAVRETPFPAQNPWAMAGRQSMMDMRRFFQLRLVR